ncbi:MAG: DNA polymerase III subunit chi [Alphaproteobacteria bacterium]|nr:DNA polymerase III subunit chi [Alphaproteobacteria bacterium]
MTEIRFYHLERQNLEQVLPSLLTRALESGRRVVVKTADDKEAERLAEYLWVHDPGSFIPHGTKKDGSKDRQPVWLTSSDENPNGAEVLILTQGAETAMQKEFSLCCEMLDGKNAQAVADARTRWKNYKEEGFDLTYWQQGAKGWEKKKF